MGFLGWYFWVALHKGDFVGIQEGAPEVREQAWDQN